MKGFSTIARPVHKLTEIKLKFLRADEYEKAFKKFKEIVGVQRPKQS